MEFMLSQSPFIAIAAFAASSLGVAALAVLGPAAIQGYRRHMNDEVGGQLRAQFINMPTSRLVMAAFVSAGLVLIITLPLLPWPVAASLGLASLAAPRLLVGFIRTRRQRTLIRQLPDALQALAASLRAGSNLGRGFELVSRRQPRPLAEEFALIIQRQRLGEDLEQILDDLHRRIPTGEIALFRSAILITRQVGGDLAGILDNLAATLRERAAVEDRVQALTAMGRMQGRVMALLPVGIGIMLYLQQPALMSQLFTTLPGQALLLVITLMTLVAILWIRRIVRIDV